MNKEEAQKEYDRLDTLTYDQLRKEFSNWKEFNEARCKCLDLIMSEDEKMELNNLSLISDAYKFGREAFGIKGCSPHENKEFMAIVPNCEFADEQGIKLRQDMYKAYINGWTMGNLMQNDEDPVHSLNLVANVASISSGKTWMK